jgi:hypothetical protein
MLRGALWDLIVMLIIRIVIYSKYLQYTRISNEIWKGENVAISAA